MRVFERVNAEEFLPETYVSFQVKNNPKNSELTQWLKENNLRETEEMRFFRADNTVIQASFICKDQFDCVQYFDSFEEILKNLKI